MSLVEDRVLLLGPVDRGEMPFGIRVWLDVPAFFGPASYFAADIQVYEKAGEEQPGR